MNNEWSPQVQKLLPVRVIGVLGITNICVTVADAASSNADVLDAVVILGGMARVGF